MKENETLKEKILKELEIMKKCDFNEENCLKFIHSIERIIGKDYIEPIYITDDGCIYNEFNNKCKMATHDIIIANKINEIIARINEANNGK